MKATTLAKCSRWDAASVTMGIRSMPWDEWIELDREFEQYRRVCEYRIRTSGARVLQIHEAQPGIVESGHAAGECPARRRVLSLTRADGVAKEFMYELAEYVSRRYPDVYSVTRHPVSDREDENGWYGEGRISTITLIPFEETYDLDVDEPLKVARMLYVVRIYECCANVSSRRAHQSTGGLHHHARRLGRTLLPPSRGFVYRRYRIVDLCPPSRELTSTPARFMEAGR